MLDMTFHIKVGETPPLEIFLIAWQRVLEELKPSPCFHILAT